MDRQKKERKKKERQERQAVEAHRLKIEANVQRISLEQARAIQRDARMRLSSRDSECPEPGAAKPADAQKEKEQVVASACHDVLAVCVLILC